MYLIDMPLRRIVRRNEKQNGKRYDILICKHSVLVTKQQTRYRRFRGCPVCFKDVERIKKEKRA